MLQYRHSSALIFPNYRVILIVDMSTAHIVSSAHQIYMSTSTWL